MEKLKGNKEETSLLNRKQKQNKKNITPCKERYCTKEIKLPQQCSHASGQFTTLNCHV